MSNSVNNKDRPQNKVVDGKTLEHVLRLLKGYIEEKDRAAGDASSNPIQVFNTDSDQVKELVYSIIYGNNINGNTAIIDGEAVDINIPLTSHFTKFIEKEIERLKTEKIDYVTEEDVLNMFKCDSYDPDLGGCQCGNGGGSLMLDFATNNDIMDLFEYIEDN